MFSQRGVFYLKELAFGQELPKSYPRFNHHAHTPLCCSFESFHALMEEDPVQDERGSKQQGIRKQCSKCVIPCRENTLLTHRRKNVYMHTILTSTHTHANVYMHTLTRVHPHIPQHPKTITRPSLKTITRPDPMIMAETVLAKLRQE